MRFVVRNDTLTRGAKGLRRRLRQMAIITAESDEPALRGLPSSSVLTRELLRQSAEAFHDGESRRQRSARMATAPRSRPISTQRMT